MAYNSAAAEARTASRLLWHRIAFSPKAWCILAVNLAAVVMVVAGLLYLNFYRSSLIEDKITILTTQGELIAVALGESIVSDTDEDGVHGIDAAAALQLLVRLAAPIETRARLYDAYGELVADSRNLPGVWGEVQTAALPPPAGSLIVAAGAVYDSVLALLPSGDHLPPYVETTALRARDYPELRPVFAGEQSSTLRDGGEMGIILNVGLPVQRFKEVQGALLLTTSINDIEDSVREVSYTIIKLFGGFLIITVLLSLYLTNIIVRSQQRNKNTDVE